MSLARLATPSLLDTTMEAYDSDHDHDNQTHHHHHSSSNRYDAKVMATPSPRTDSENNQHEHEDDDDGGDEEQKNGNDDDDVFRFDAPAYYDLKNPALEARYVNNADGYFTPEYKPRTQATTPAATPAPASSFSSPTRTKAPATAPPAVRTPRHARTQALPVTAPAYSRFPSEQQSQQPRAAAHSFSSNQDDTAAVAQQQQRLRTQYREPQKAEPELDDDDAVDAHMSDGEDDERANQAIETSVDMHIDELSAAATLETASFTRSLYEAKDESFEEVFAHYASSSTSSSRTSLAHLLQEPTATASPPRTAPARAQHHSDAMTSGHYHASGPPPPAPRSTGYVPSASSKLLQPTQAFLRRIHTEQAMREQYMLEGAPLEDKPMRLTKPRSPTLLTSKKAEQAYRDPNDPSRMSYTSRELLKIQEERLRVQMEKMKIREFHERTKTQRPPANVHQRSTKQLTIPVSPYLEVGHRTRRFHDDSANGAATADKADNVPAIIRPETLMSRDFALPVPQPQAPSSHDITVRTLECAVCLSRS